MTSTANFLVNKVIEIGPVIIIPLILFIAGFFTTKNQLKNFLNCLYIFIGLIGLSILLAVFLNFFKPLIEMIVASSPKSLIVADVGWLASKNVILNSPITFQIIIALISVNIIMLFLRLTRTINIDIWNWWILLLAGSLMFSITEIRWLGVLVAVIIYAITLVINDIYTPFIESYYGIKGVSNPQTQFALWAPVTHLVNVVLNKIPIVRKAHIFYDEIQYKLGTFTEPMVLGFILGFIAGLVSKYKFLLADPWPNLRFAAMMGLQLAIIMILMPRFVYILYKGLSPSINNINLFISRKITKRDLNIGLDAIFFAGHPAVIASSIIIIPLCVYIATILPGNNILPSADLIIIPFLLVWIIAQSRGDIFRSFISSLIIIPLTLWISSDMNSLFGNFFQKYNIEFADGIGRVSSYSAGSNWLFWILLQIIKPILDLFS